MSDRPTSRVTDLVRLAVDVCDPRGRDPALGRFEQQLEDDDEPVTAVENLEERLALASEGADHDLGDPANGVVLYLAAHGGRADYDRDRHELVRLAVRAQWHKDPPRRVADWLAGRETGR
jgi:hypothetical protein